MTSKKLQWSSSDTLRQRTLANPIRCPGCSTAYLPIRLHGAQTTPPFGPFDLHKSSVFSIMHISDLHRSPGDAVSNVRLIQSLLADKDNYVNYGVRTPDAIVVSGDLIWGAGFETADYSATIRSQYNDATDFLCELTNRFLDGDRSRVVIAPGNHDCCWNTAKSSMRQVKPNDEPPDLQRALHSTPTRFRWCWNDRSLYEIVDQDLYRRRLDPYWDCVEQFYLDVDLVVPFCRKRGFNIFEFEAGRVVFVAFESQSQNDHLANYGFISDDSISECDVLFRDLRLNPTLKVAVWHHGIAGTPTTSDYLDMRCVTNMIATGFRLGLHGHQHYADTSVQYVHLPVVKEMAVVGAGSLCAGERHLPHTVNRQYNLLAIHDAYDGADVYVREVTDGHQFGTTRDPKFSPDGHMKINWEPLKDMAGRPIDHDAVNLREKLLTAEQALDDDRPACAIEALASLDLGPSSYAKALYVRAAQSAEREDLLVNILEPPDNADELVALVFAVHKASGATAALATLHRHRERVSLSPSVARDIADRIEFRRTVTGGKSRGNG